MRDLQMYAKECVSDLNAIGIEVPYIKEFKVNTRAKSRFGQCRKIAKNVYEIEICNDLLADDCPIEALRETLFHELIHTLPNCMNHKTEFKRYANIVNNAYGVNITRCSTSEEKYGVEYAKKLEENRPTKLLTRYQLRCVNCGRIVAEREGYRAPKWYAHPNRFSCGHCHGKVVRV